MIFLIREETTVFGPISETKEKIVGYYECDNEDEVTTYCKCKESELHGSYKEDIMSKSYYYTKLKKL